MVVVKVCCGNATINQISRAYFVQAHQWRPMRRSSHSQERAPFRTSETFSETIARESALFQFFHIIFFHETQLTIGWLLNRLRPPYCAQTWLLPACRRFGRGKCPFLLPKEMHRRIPACMQTWYPSVLWPQASILHPRCHRNGRRLMPLTEIHARPNNALTEDCMWAAITQWCEQSS